MNKILSDEGFEPVLAANGSECMDILTSQKPDLILLDVLMPDIEGTDLCKKIKSDPEMEGVLIILISGMKISEDDIRYGLDAGADDYISRPVDRRRLAAKIRALLRLRDTLVQKRQEQPWSSFEHENTSTTARVFQQQPLKEMYPDRFEKYVNSYGELIQTALELRIYKSEEKITPRIQVLAQDLGFIKAGARDVIDIHKVALSRISDDLPVRRLFYIKEESRIILVELMGYLANFYRNRPM
jgi:DNA-binding response OmpR family regulator